MPITDPSEEYFKDGSWGWNGTKWVKGGVPYAYLERWVEDLGGTKSGDGAWFADTTAVPAGYVYVAQCLTLRNLGGARGTSLVYFTSGALAAYLGYSAGLARYVPLIWNGQAPLAAGDKAAVYMSGCLDGDDIEAVVWGYKMKVA